MIRKGFGALPNKVAILGVGMTRFAKHLDKSLRDLGREAILEATKDAGIELKDIQMACVGNAYGGLITGQESIRGQTILRELGLGGIPIINTENACATGTSALFIAWMAVASGYCDIALALGVEKLCSEDVSQTQLALATSSDIGVEGSLGLNFVGFYALEAQLHMNKYGITQQQIAKVAVKNHRNGSLNPCAQFKQVFTLEEVLNSRLVAWPITLYMCAPMGDGASAAVLVNHTIAKKYTTKPVFIKAITMASGGIFRPWDGAYGEVVKMLAGQAYESAGIGPKDINVAELTAAFSPAEISLCESLGFCREGEGGVLIDQKATEITGHIPVNPSGGLEAKGHPVAATGLAQIAEVAWQLRGRAGKRQIEPQPKVGLVQNAGGLFDGEIASCTVTIMQR